MKLIKFLYIPFVLITIIFSLNSCNDAGVVIPEEGIRVFIKTYGGPLSDKATSIQHTFDGGMLISGYTISAGSGGNDGFALKLNYKGETQWYNVFGGSADDQINAAYSASDGGYIFVGETVSFASTLSDIYAVKLDAGGNLVWSKYYRMAGSQFGSSVTQTADFGFLICGYTDGSGAGNNDAIVIKIDFNGNPLWINTYGETFNDYGVSVRSFSDNSIIMAGYTFSGGAGQGDISLVRITANGDVTWTKYYGGDGLDQPSDLEITTDNGYIVSGTTYSFGLSSGDAYAFRTDGNGFIFWSRTFGGPNLDRLFSIKQTGDGKFISTGLTGSYGLGLEDIFVLKLFGDGEFEWAKAFGSHSYDAGSYVMVRNDTGYVTTGYTQSYGAGNNDIYTIAMNQDGITCSADFPVTPNAGSPVTLIAEPIITMLPVSPYEAVNAGTGIISVGSGENTVCMQ